MSQPRELTTILFEVAFGYSVLFDIDIKKALILFIS